MKKIISLSLLTLLSLSLDAQIYDPAYIGTYSSVLLTGFYGGVLGNPSFVAAGPCGSGFIWTGPTSADGYKYIFSSSNSVRINGIKILTYQGNNGESLRLTVNGQPYTITAANISTYAPACTGFSTSIASGGDLVVQGGAVCNTNVLNGQIDIQGFDIDSLTLLSPNINCGGNGFSFLVEATKDTFVSIPQPFIDTFHCAGDSVYLLYTTSPSFRSGNSFTAQLSDASGSFASPVTIGFLTATAGPGYIPCKIPASTTPGTGYLVRIVSGFPARTSLHDGRNIIIRPYPAKPVAAANTPVCVADTLRLTASDATGGLSYSWAGPAGFASSSKDTNFAIPSLLAAGSYIVSANLAGCIKKDTAIVTVKPLPAAVFAGNDTSLCEPFTLALAGSSSTAGVSWKWDGPGSYTNSLQNTTRTNTTAAMSGNYILSVTLNGCTVKDTEAVQVRPLPAKPDANSNTPVCPNTSLNLTATSTTTGVTWGWAGPGSFSSTQKNPTKINIAFADAGNYIVTDTLDGCIAKDTAIVVVAITTPTPVAGSNSPVCAGGTLNLTASPVSGAIYNWAGPAPYTANTQNPSRANVALADAGTYTVTANVNGCVSLPASTNVTVVNGPSVVIYPSPNDSICAGTNVALVTIPFNIGSGATYDWYKNGISTGTTANTLITSNFSTGDIFYVLMTAGSACNTPVISNSIKMTTLPATPPPTATIVATPATNIWPGLFVSFSSSITNGGNSPSYQWKRNSKNVVGATAATWGAADLNNNDTICLSVTSSDQCATPKSVLSNCIEMSIATGVPLNPPGGDFSVYPNPNNGMFTFSSLFGSQPLNPLAGDLYVYTLQGQVVASYTISAAKTVIELPKGLSAGVYMGRYVSGSGKASVLRIVVE